jgi:hypothetical protein
MTRVEVTEDEFAYIVARVESFASEAAADWHWQGDSLSNLRRSLSS